MTPRTNARPTHNLTFTDGTDTIGLILCDPQGRPDPRAIREVPMPKTSMQISQGDPTYGTYQLPYTPMTQKDFSGGRGLLEFSKDSTRYYDAYNVNTSGGDAVLGPGASDAEFPSTPPGPPGTGNAECTTAGYELCHQFTTAAGDPTYLGLVQFRCNDDGTATGTWTCKIRTDDGSNHPTATVVSSKQSAAGGWNVTFNIVLAASTKYWFCVVVPTHGHLDYENTGGSGILRWTGATYTAFDADAYLLYLMYGSTVNDYLFFEYQGQLYALSRSISGGAPQFFESGKRGFSLNNPSNRSVLMTGLNLTAVDLTGCVAKIIAGPGSTEAHPYRVITSNTTTGTNDTISVDPPWSLAHTTATEYVILGMDTWTEITGHGITTSPTDVLVVADILYVALGKDTNIRRGHLASGAWTWADDGTNKADFLEMITDSTGSRKVWNALAVASTVAKSDVKAWASNLVFGTAITCGDTRTRITNLVSYGNPTVPWVFKEDCFGSVTSDIFGPVPLAEMAAVKDYDNGIAATAWGLYLFFNLGIKFERFLDNRLDDLGPDKDEGLPADRQGVITCVIPYPGGIYAVMDASPWGYSAILYWNQQGWHEIYRRDVGERISHIYLQVIPGICDRLWVACGGEPFYLTISPNPRREDGYYFAEREYLDSAELMNPCLITSWYQGAFGEIVKYWASLTIHSEGCVAGHQYFTVSYQTDAEGDDDAWHAIDNFVTSPSERHPISLTHDVSGKRIRFKIEFVTDDHALSPRLKALTLDSVTRVPPASSWSITFLASTWQLDQQGHWFEVSESSLVALLAKWTNSDEWATPLLMGSEDPAYNGRYVFIDPASVSPLSTTIEANNQAHTVKVYTLAIFETED